MLHAAQPRYAATGPGARGSATTRVGGGAWAIACVASQPAMTAVEPTTMRTPALTFPLSRSRVTAGRWSAGFATHRPSHARSPASRGLATCPPARSPSRTSKRSSTTSQPRALAFERIAGTGRSCGRSSTSGSDDGRRFASLPTPPPSQPFAALTAPAGWRSSTSTRPRRCPRRRVRRVAHALSDRCGRQAQELGALAGRPGSPRAASCWRRVADALSADDWRGGRSPSSPSHDGLALTRTEPGRADLGTNALARDAVLHERGRRCAATRRRSPPEDAGRIPVEFIKSHKHVARRLEVVVQAPARVAIAPVERPGPVLGGVPEPGDLHAASTRARSPRATGPGTRPR